MSSRITRDHHKLNRALTLSNGETIDNNVDDTIRLTSNVSRLGTNGHLRLYDNEIEVASGNLTLDISGTIELNADGGAIAFNDGTNKASEYLISPLAGRTDLIIYEGGGVSNDDFFNIRVIGNGATTISTTDDAGADASLTITPDGTFSVDNNSSGADLSLTSGRDLTITGDRNTSLISSTSQVYITPEASNNIVCGSPMKIKESANAFSDTASYGQLWIKNSTPNELAFTDDAGTDIIGIGKYYYDIKYIAYNAGTSFYAYLPINGYIFESTTTASRNEYHSFIAPYDGTIHQLQWRTEEAVDASTSFRIFESSDGTEVPGTISYRKDIVVDVANNTTYNFDLSSPTTGSTALVKGRIYALYYNFGADTNDTNFTVIFKWDITS